jgi:molybdopterin synthase catalytic subunit
MEGWWATDSIRSVKIQLLAFASAADALGTDQLEVEIPSPATVSALGALLRARFPALEPLWPRLAVAVDGELAAADRALSPGVEVALLPPVSGGSGSVAGAVTGLTEQAIDIAQVTAAVGRKDRGAVLLFLGTVRDHHRGRPVTHLTYSAYRPMASQRLRRIVEELEAGGEVAAEIVHRLGRVAAGEPSVVIAVASAHRQAAYEASRRALERLKKEVPIWKREHYADGGVEWREEEPLVPAVEN